MATLFNDQPVIGVVLIDDGRLIYNNRPVIGVREVAEAVLFEYVLRTLGVAVIDEGPSIYNDGVVIGAKVIDDASTMYNGSLVLPVSVISGGLGDPPEFSAQPSITPAQGEPGAVFTLVSGTAADAVITTEFFRVNGVDATGDLVGDTYTSTADAILTFRQRASNPGHYVLSDTVEAIVNTLPVLSNLDLDTGVTPAVLSADSTEYGTAYFATNGSATPLTGEAIKALVDAATPLVYGTYEVVAESLTTDIDLTPLTVGTYYLHTALKDNQGGWSDDIVSGAIVVTAPGVIPSFKAAGALNSQNGNTTFAWPAGHAVNDVAGLFLHIQNSLGAGFLAADLTAAGWTPWGNVNGTRRLVAYWKRATSTSEAAAPVNEDGTDAFTRAYGRIITFQDCVTTGDPGVLIGSQTQSASTSVTFVDGNTSGDNRLVVGIMGAVLDADTSQLSAGFTNAGLADLANVITDNSSSGAGFGLYAFAGEKAAAGAVGNTTGTITASVEMQQILIELIGA